MKNTINTSIISNANSPINEFKALKVIGSNLFSNEASISFEYLKLITDINTMLELIKSTSFLSFQAVLLATP